MAIERGFDGLTVVQRAADVEVAMLADVTVIQRAVQYLVPIRYVAVDVIYRIAELVPHYDLPLALLALLDEVDHYYGAAVPTEQVLEVRLRRLVGGIDSIENYGRLGHGDRALLRPERRYRPSYLEVAGEDALGTGRRRRFVVHDLLVLDVVRDLSAVGHAPLEVARACEVARASGEEHEVERSSVVVELALDEGAVDHGEDPVEARYGVGALLELPRQEEVPR